MMGKPVRYVQTNEIDANQGDLSQERILKMTFILSFLHNRNLMG